MNEIDQARSDVAEGREAAIAAGNAIDRVVGLAQVIRHRGEVWPAAWTAKQTICRVDALIQDARTLPRCLAIGRALGGRLVGLVAATAALEQEIDRLRAESPEGPAEPLSPAALETLVAPVRKVTKLWAAAADAAIAQLPPTN